MSMNTAMHRPRNHLSRRRQGSPPAGEYAHYAPRLIGYGLLALAVLLIGIGIATA
jgi:hypothetical protein